MRENERRREEKKEERRREEKKEERRKEEKKEEKMRRNLRHIIPSHMLRNSRRRDNPEDESMQGSAHDCGVKMIWCGEKGAVTDVRVPNMCEETVDWSSAEGSWQLFLAPGTFDIEITLSTGRPVWSGQVSLQDEEWQTLEVGHIFDSCQRHPGDRSQFSFPNGRSSCSFLCCYATIVLHDLLGLGSDIARTEMTGEDVMRIVDEGMSLFEDSNISTLLQDLGMEHMSVEEAIEFCGHAWSDRGTLQIKETFWGSLGEPSSILLLLQQATSSSTAAPPAASVGSREQEISFLCMTKPPETILLLIAPSLNLYCVLDTHTRMIGASQYPASIYRCRSLEDLALLLSTNFFPLPPGIDIEELGSYAMFELVSLHFSPSRPQAPNFRSQEAKRDAQGARDIVQEEGPVRDAGAAEERREEKAGAAYTPEVREQAQEEGGAGEAIEILE